MSSRPNPVGSIPAHWIVDASTGCWIWQGHLTKGYGMIDIGNTGKKYVHILMFVLKYGNIPPGLELDHVCRNRSCVNPDHVEIVTRAVNIQRGKLAKMNPDSVRELRKLYDKGLRDKKLGEIFQISSKEAGQIGRRQRWKSVPEEVTVNV